MNDSETVEATRAGYELLCSQARVIAMLPLEDWLTAINRAESIGPILDPTLYREYLYSDNGRILKQIIEAAIPLKKVVMAAQPAIKPKVPHLAVAQALLEKYPTAEFRENE